MLSRPGTSELRMYPASSLSGLASASGSATAERLGVFGRDEGDRDSFVVAQRQHGLANARVFGLVGQRDHRAGKRRQRIGKIVVAVNARQFFQHVNLAFHIEPPGGNRDTEPIADCR